MYQRPTYFDFWYKSNDAYYTPILKIFWVRQRREASVGSNSQSIYGSGSAQDRKNISKLESCNEKVKELSHFSVTKANKCLLLMQKVSKKFYLLRTNCFTLMLYLYSKLINKGKIFTYFNYFKLRANGNSIIICTILYFLSL